MADTESNGRGPRREGRPDPGGAGEQLTVGSLFAGVGGFDLGLERAGMRVVWFCEQNPYRRRVLARHWPGVPCHPDVCALVADTEGQRRSGEVLSRKNVVHNGSQSAHGDEGDRPGQVPVPVPHVDVLCGGFPCQDLSLAGRGAGIEGSRSGLWREFARLIGELRPRYVLVENVPALLTRGGHRVLEDLAACGFDAEWDCLPASAFGAPHRRDRAWIVAYPHDSRSGTEDERRPLHDPVRGRHRPPQEQIRPGRDGTIDAGWWLSEPDVGRVAHGIPNRVDRLAALGDSLVPQIAEWIGTRIVSFEQQRQRTEAAA